jgi:hypothetical protein
MWRKGFVSYILTSPYRHWLVWDVRSEIISLGTQWPRFLCRDKEARDCRQCSLFADSCTTHGCWLPSRFDRQADPNWTERKSAVGSKSSRSSTCPPYVRTLAAALHETCTSFRFLSCVGIHGGLSTCSGWHTLCIISAIWPTLCYCCVWFVISVLLL